MMGNLHVLQDGEVLSAISFVVIGFYLVLKRKLRGAKIQSLQLHLEKQMPDIEQKVENFAKVELKQTSQGLHIDFSRRCDDDAIDRQHPLQDSERT